MQLVYKPKALEEFEQSTEWYANRSINTAKNFVETVRSKIELIKQNPTAQRKKYKHFYEI